jgi:hypothetical protein
MAELILEPYAVLQHWNLPLADTQWEAILAGYLQILAQKCQEAAGTFLGHIKALALFSDETYLRISVIDPGRPASVEGRVPAGQRTLDLTLNVIVYGLKHDYLEQVAEETAAKIAAQWKGEVTSQEIHPHHASDASQSAIE